MFCTPVTCLGC